MPKQHPVFDRSRPYGSIMYGEPPAEGERFPVFNQDGAYFCGDGSFHSYDGQKPVAASAAPPPVDTLPGISEEEVPLYEGHPKFQELLLQPRDVIVRMVTDLNGPTVAGDNAQRVMAAWLIRATEGGPGEQASKAASERAALQGSGDPADQGGVTPPADAPEL